METYKTLIYKDETINGYKYAKISNDSMIIGSDFPILTVKAISVEALKQFHPTIDFSQVELVEVELTIKK